MEALQLLDLAVLSVEMHLELGQKLVSRGILSMEMVVTHLVKSNLDLLAQILTQVCVLRSAEMAEMFLERFATMEITLTQDVYRPVLEQLLGINALEDQ